MHGRTLVRGGFRAGIYISRRVADHPIRRLYCSLEGTFFQQPSKGPVKSHKYPESHSGGLRGILKLATMGNVWNKDFANDIIVVMQPDGTLRCSAVSVRFRHEKDVANRDKRIVTVSINGIVLNPKFSLNELNDGGSRFASSCLEKVRLRDELNYITFTIRLRGQVVQVEACMFLWCWDSRIVTADVDGTITKSDLRGILFPLIGVDWVHDGICHLFSAIQKNGYKVIYLTGRPRYEAEATRNFLDGIVQGGKFLPKGPVILSPGGWRDAIGREFSDRQDVDFKIPMLEHIRELFPLGKGANPFHAGFGDRPSDDRTYRELKILCKRIFQLNTSEGGIEVKCEEETLVAFFPDSYNWLFKFVDYFFPQVQDCAAPQHSQTFARRAKIFFRNLTRGN